MNIPSDHPLLLDNLAKAQTDSEKFLRSTIQPFDTRESGKAPSFNYDRAIDQYRSWIYAAINLNATAVASLPLRLYVRRRPDRTNTGYGTARVPVRRRKYLLGDNGHFPQRGPHRDTIRKLGSFGDDFEEVTESHPVLDLIQKVNPWFNGFDLMQLLVIYIESTGNAYWHPVVDPDTGVPGTVWPLPSQWVRVILDEEEFIAGYQYGRSSVRSVQFDADEVIQFRTANPSDEGIYYGMGKIEAGWSVVTLNDEQHTMDLAFTENNARPDYLAVVKSGADDASLDRFEAQVERKLKHATLKAGKFLTLTGDVSLTPLNFPPKDITGREDIVEEIAAVFGVPVSLLKANDPNLASASVGYASWKSNTVLPLARMIEQKLNEALLPLFGIEDDACLAFDDPVPEDRAFQLQESTALVAAGIRTINEDRALRGEEPIEGGDLVRIGGQSLEKLDADPAGFEVPGFRLTAGSQRPGPSAIAATVPARTPSAIAALPGPKEKRLSEVMWKADAEDDVREDEPDAPHIELARLLADMFDDELAAVQAILRGGSTVRSATPLRWKVSGRDLQQIERRLQDFIAIVPEEIVPVMERMLEASGRAAISGLGVEVGFDVTNPEVVRWLRTYAIRLAGEIQQSTVDAINRVVRRGITEGATNDAIADSISDSGVFDRSRALTIARSETARAYTHGTEEGWRQSGVVAGKKWLLAPNACQFCKAAAAQYSVGAVPLGRPFYTQGQTLTGTDGGKLRLDYDDVDGPPLHPNCRCSLIAEME